MTEKVQIERKMNDLWLYMIGFGILGTVCMFFELLELGLTFIFLSPILSYTVKLMNEKESSK